MPKVGLFFQVHQPLRLRRFNIFNAGADGGLERYFDLELNERIFRRVADKCYIPANALLLDLISKFDGRFKVTFSLTGVFLEQAARFEPSVLDSFEELAKSGCVDFLSETYYHSLSALYPEKDEFKEQVALHRKALCAIGAPQPVVFRNTEALFSNEIARLAEEMGFAGIITEGWESFLGWRSPNYIYRVRGCERIRALLRNYRLSDDVSYRFSASWWPEHPLTADKYAAWLAACEGDVIILYMDYETFGEHQWPETGIFEFLRHLPAEVLRHPHLSFVTAREAIALPPVGEIDVPHPISWADMERDTSAWLGNDMQRDVFRYLQEIEPLARAAGGEHLHIWRLLQSSDHLYYLCTKHWADGDVHKYFSPYDNPCEGYMNFMNILQDLKFRLENGIGSGGV
ncbi:MAG: glycoside hydrolase family 57 protein [Candidatus Micrarchaeia archaeon]